MDTVGRRAAGAENGGMFMQNSAPQPPPAGTEPPAETPRQPIAFSEREREILREVVAGATNRVIAQRVNLSVDTVKYHMKNLLKKTGCASRTELAVLACREGLAGPGGP